MMKSQFSPENGNADQLMATTENNVGTALCAIMACFEFPPAKIIGRSVAPINFDFFNAY
jgi:hypothetical protein